MRLITVEGYWKDNCAAIHATCAIGLDMHEDDDSVFYYFDESEPIIGDHGEFVITSVEG